MVKITLRLDKRYRLASGEYPLKLAIARGGTTVYVPINISLQENEWDKVQQKVKLRADRKTLNLILQETLVQANRKILALQAEGTLRSMNNKALAKHLSADMHQTDSDRHLFRFQAERYLTTVSNKRTKEIYLSTLYHLKATGEYDTLHFEDMNIAWLKEFDAYLSQQGMAVNTRAIHMRNIRSIFNFALDSEEISVYPFRRYKIKTEETRKRSLTVSQLRSILNADVTPSQEKYRDIFLLIFMLMGINMIDLSRLTKIEKCRINYKRAKTGRLYSVKVEPEAMRIIEKYRGEKHLLRFFDTNSDYRNFEKKLNNAMTKIANSCGIEGRISSYWARHTFATVAASIDIPRDTISECLGHRYGSKVTAVYVNYDLKKVDDANRRVIDYVLGK